MSHSNIVIITKNLKMAEELVNDLGEWFFEDGGTFIEDLPFNPDDCPYAKSYYDFCFRDVMNGEVFLYDDRIALRDPFYGISDGKINPQCFTDCRCFVFDTHW